MFKSRAEKILLVLIILAIILIPSGSFLLSERFRAQDFLKLGGKQSVSSSPLPGKGSALDSLKKNLESSLPKSDSQNLGGGSSPEVFFGPTLSFEISIEARPNNKQATRLFLGVAQGEPTTNPQYLLSFNIDVPDSGKYSGLSLAGLTQGSTYTAYLKGLVQVATSSAFQVKPTVNDLGKLGLLTGDLNEDNVINSLDFTIIKAAYGAISSSSNWVAHADFNLDGVINNFDVGTIIKNLGSTGTSGVWVSRLPQATSSATQSGTLQAPNTGSPSGSPGGYWLFIPQI